MQAFDLMEERTPGAAPDGATARIAFQAPEDETLAEGENQQLVLDMLDAAQTDHVVAVSDPFEMGTVFEDGRTAYATVSYDRASVELTEGDRDGASVDEIAKRAHLAIGTTRNYLSSAMAKLDVANRYEAAL